MQDSPATATLRLALTANSFARTLMALNAAAAGIPEVECDNCWGLGEMRHPRSVGLDSNNPAMETVECEVCKGRGVVPAPVAEEGDE